MQNFYFIIDTGEIVAQPITTVLKDPLAPLNHLITETLKRRRLLCGEWARSRLAEPA